MKWILNRKKQQCKEEDIESDILAMMAGGRRYLVIRERKS